MASVRETRGCVSLFEVNGTLDDQTFADYLRVLDANVAKAEPFAMVVDGSTTGVALACQPPRRWQLNRAKGFGKHHRGVAFVTGTMTQERMQALYAMQAPGVPYAFLSTRDEALEWAQAAVDGERTAAISERKTVPFMTAVP